MVYKWIERFESGWDDLCNSPHAGRPKWSKTKIDIELIQRILDEDRRITVKELEERMSNVVVRWAQKGPKRQSEKNFLDRIMIRDETWFHYYEPKTKEQSIQWRRRDEPVSLKKKKSAGKRMASFLG